MRPHSDMNITPLIDVLLVLLVIFLASLPLNEREERATLPPETAANSTLDVTDRIVAELSAARVLTINHQPVALLRAEAFFRDVYASRHDRTLYVIGDGSLRYGEVMTVINAAKEAGVTTVGIVTDGMRAGR